MRNVAQRCLTLFEGGIYMPISPSVFVPYEAKNIMMKIYSYSDKNVCGSLSNLFLDDDLSFQNLTQMLFGIEHILDTTQFPQQSLLPRSFSPQDPATPRHGRDYLPDNGDKKAIATFKLSVLFRQNASWQGTLVWLDENSEVQFRSALELILLLDSVLQGK